MAAQSAKKRKAIGRAGGYARSAKMSAAERTASARKAALGRWVPRREDTENEIVEAIRRHTTKLMYRLRFTAPEAMSGVVANGMAALVRDVERIHGRR